MSLLLLWACMPEIPVKPGNFRPPFGDADTDADADTDTDTDADADADTDVGDPEDCDNGKDDDGDGLADCEDGDCVEECVEDCDDQKDNDQDGDVDCADDECAADTACAIVWDYELLVEPWETNLAYGPSIGDWGGYGAAAWMSGALLLSASSSEGDEFVCQGEFYTGPELWDSAGGLTYSDGTCGSCDYRFKWAPREDDGTLHWWEGCPERALPVTYLGFTQDKEKINGEWRSWSNVYRGETEWGYEDDRGDFYWAAFWNMEQIEPRTWQVIEPK
ncbi:MAG: hypothetical protein GY913_06880 [Proteobacteria bacterium]|nr:hypothetical protein [Pseudomonadota bacterium]MCP4916631.1 hypothetical protein [Pseudomonadota bacterium]